MFKLKIRLLFTIPILFTIAACSGDGEDSLLSDSEVQEGY